MNRRSLYFLAALMFVSSPPVLAQPDEEETFGPEDEKRERADDATAEPAPAPEPPRSESTSSPAATPAETPATTSNDELSMGKADASAKSDLSIGVSGGSNDSVLQTPGQIAPEAAADYDIRVFGFLRFIGSLIQDDPEVQFVGRNDGFRLQNARVGLEGRFKKRIMVRISADGANDRRDAPNDIEGTLTFGLADAFADVRLAHALELRAGRFPVIFDLERFTSAVQRGFVARSLESRGVSPTEGFETPGLGVSRNLGLALRAPRAFDSGGVSLGYEVAAQNGNGSFAAQNDNDALAYSGSFITYFGQYVMLFGSVRYNERTEGELPFRRTERDLGTAFGTWFQQGGFRLAGQLIFRRTTFPTTGEGVEIAWGGHAELLYTIPGTNGLRGGYRFAILDESDRMPSNRVMEHTVGAGYSVPSYGVDFMLNFTLPIEEAGRELDNLRGELLVGVRL